MPRDYALLFNGNAVVVFDITHVDYDLHWNYSYNTEQNTISFVLNIDEQDLELTVPSHNVSFVRNFDINKFRIDDFIRKVYGDHVQIQKTLYQDFTIAGYKTRILQKHRM